MRAIMHSPIGLVSKPEQRSEQRYPCVGIALIYSAVQNGNVAGLGSALHRAAIMEMSLRGLSFDVGVPLLPGQELVLQIAQPDGGAYERLISEVRWCEQLGNDHYRVGVRIGSAARVTRDLSGQHNDFTIGIGPAMPVGAELLCPACNRQTTFRLVGQQAVGRRDVMPLYDCGGCGSTRSIVSILAHSRRPADDASVSERLNSQNVEPSVIPDLRRILYVEDEPDIQAVAKLALERVGGFSVRICSSGEEALREAPGFAPDLILLDVMMAGMDGPETLRALRENTALADIPVAFMTAKMQPAEVAHLKSLSAHDVIPKPFDPMQLATQVRTILNSHNGVEKL